MTTNELEKVPVSPTPASEEEDARPVIGGQCYPDLIYLNDRASLKAEKLADARS